MWIVFGIGALIALVINLVFYRSHKRADFIRFISISLTALTVCAFYAQNKAWVLAEDWGALTDVVPTTSTMLWILVFVSIFINGISLIERK